MTARRFVKRVNAKRNKKVISNAEPMDTDAPSEEGFRPNWRAPVDPEVRRAREDKLAARHLADLKAMLAEKAAENPPPEPAAPCNHEFIESRTQLHTLECKHCPYTVEHPERRKALQRRSERLTGNGRKAG